MDLDAHTRDIWIALGTLSGLGIFVALIRTWTWYSKSGRQIIDIITLGKILLHIFGIIGTVILLVIGSVSVWWLIFFKREYNNTFESRTNSLQNIFRILLIVSFVLKTIDIFHLIIRQTLIDVFFMDWERSKTGNADGISAWRTCFIANEFNEIQTFRRIHVSFHLLFVLFFLKVINFENYATADSNYSLSSSISNHTIEYNRVFRTGIAFPILLGTAFIQYFFYIIFYQRIIEDKILNFIDLCSVSNISVFILDENEHGYYIHGRSPHGITDVNMKDMIINLEREARSLSGTRGLETNSMEQLFILRINRSFRIQYELLLNNYSGFTRKRQRREDTEHYTNTLHRSYQNLNSFLCAFIDHSLPNHQYSIRNRYFLEKIFNYEFQIGNQSNLTGYFNNIFLIDNEQTFTRILFYGEENTLFIWNVITFIFIDYLALNYILAATITYFLNLIIVGLRNSFGRRNLSRKTLVPRELLI